MYLHHLKIYISYTLPEAESADAGNEVGGDEVFDDCVGIAGC